MIEPISEVLLVAGTEMKFPSYSIRGLPGFEISVLYKGEQTLYETRVQAFTFNIASADIVTNNLTEEDEFTITDGTYFYTFIVAKNPEQDLTGWSVLIADYKGKTNV